MSDEGGSILKFGKMVRKTTADQEENEAPDAVQHGRVKSGKRSCSM